MTKIMIFSVIWYLIFITFSKMVAKVIKKDSQIIANNLEHIENKEYTENTSKRISFKIKPPLAIIICLIPIINILFDILIFAWIYMELLVLVAMKNTKANL